MSWRQQQQRSTEFHLNGGRNAFRMAGGFNDAWEAADAADAAEILRQHSAMRSFTESVDSDLPPAPELPQSLDIDYQYPKTMTESETADTIVEVLMKPASKTTSSDYDKTLGATQKYPMVVPGPGHVDAEQELHESLLQREEESSESDFEVKELKNDLAEPRNGSVKKTRTTDADHEALRREYSISAVQRPRPTTPTSWCAIENYVEGSSSTASSHDRSVPPDAGARMRVSIPQKDGIQPGLRRRRSSMSWSDFYEAMATQIPPQARSASMSGRESPMNDYDGDILEEDPRYKKMAPPKPVIHRRSSTDWENFEEDKARLHEAMDAKTSAQNSEAKVMPQPDEERASAFTNAPFMDQTQVVPNVESEGVMAANIFESDAFVLPSKPTTGAQVSSQEESLATVPGGEPPSLPNPTDSIASVVMEETSVCTSLSNVPKVQQDVMNEGNQEWGDKQEFTPQTCMPTSLESREEVQKATSGYEHSDERYGEASGEYGKTNAVCEQTAGASKSEGEGYQQTATQSADEQNRASVAYWEAPLQSYGQSSDVANTMEGQSGGDTSFQGGQSAEQSSGVIDPQQYYSSTYDAGASYSTYDTSTTQPDYYQYGMNATESQEQQRLQSVGYTPESSYGVGGNDYSQYHYNATSSSYDAQPTDTSQYASSYYGMEYNAPDFPPPGQYGDGNTYASGQGTESYQHPNGAEYVTGQQTSDTAYSAGVSDSTEGGYRRSPVVPQFMAPLLPELNRPGPVDPFSWEAQESAGVPTYGMQSSVQSQPPQTSFQSDESQSYSSQSNFAQQYGQTMEVHAGVAQPEAKKPPPRPAPPPAGAHGGPPHRPPPPSPKTAPKKPPPPHITEHPAPPPKKPPEPEPEEDAWSQFKKLTEKANEAVRSTEEKLKELSETTAAKDIKDESYLSEIGGSQAYVPELAQKQIRAQQEMATQKKMQKKKAKAQGKRAPSPEFTPGQEDNLDRAAQELAKKMAATRMDLGDWKPPSERETIATATDVEKENIKTEMEVSASRHSTEQQQSESVDVPVTSQQGTGGFNKPIEDISQEPQHSGWAGFDDQSAPELPPSESGFFAAACPPKNDTFDLAASADPFAPKKTVDPFAPTDDSLFSENYDPFDVRSAEDLVEAAKARAAAEAAAIEAQNDVDFFGGGIPEEGHSTLSSPTPEGGSPVSSRPTGFEDDFRVDEDAMSTPTPLFDEDDSEPLTDFPPKFTGDGWELMVRHPIKKKIMGDRYWKPCFVKIVGNTLQLCNSRTDQKPFQEVLLQATYSLSDTTLQAYDVYGKIHTVKLQYVLYKERVGIRPGQISRLVEGHITKYGLPLEHSAQCTVLLKFGSLNAAELSSFVSTVEDILFRCITKRDTSPIYKQDEVQVHCYDEYYGYVDKNNLLSDQKARVRLFCLAFVSGSPILEIGLNDRRRQGKEIVRRKDILPMYTERWIRFENVEFHNVVEKETFDKEQVIRFSPPDGCFFEVMRFRVRPPKNREKPLTVKCVMKIAGSKIEIRLEAMVAAQADKSKDGKSAKRQIPCEDIQIRFPIPEAWIYLFREERHWGVGSVHAKVRRPGKVKNLKDRLMGTVQNIENSLIEAAIGEAKYEHVYRALVWRIPRLPEKHHAAYKQHLLRCRFELSSFDLMPETFLPTCDVEFTMPLATISNTVVRSVSVEQHEDSDRVEKFVRYVAKCSYKVEVDYVQCTDLDIDAILDPTVVNPEASQDVLPEMHKPAINPDDVNEVHGGYRIDFSDAEIGAGKFDGAADSSSDEEEDKNKMPIIQIDMKGYGY